MLREGNYTFPSVFFRVARERLDCLIRLSPFARRKLDRPIDFFPFPERNEAVPSVFCSLRRGDSALAGRDDALREGNPTFASVFSSLRLVFAAVRETEAGIKQANRSFVSSFPPFASSFSPQSLAAKRFSLRLDGSASRLNRLEFASGCGAEKTAARLGDSQVQIESPDRGARAHRARAKLNPAARG